MEINKAKVSANARSIQQEINWLSELIQFRFHDYFNPSESSKDIGEIAPPNLSADDSPFASYITRKNLDVEERLALALVACSHFQPEILDVFFTKNTLYDRGFTEFAGVKSDSVNGFTPTVGTVLFILAGADLERRLKIDQKLRFSGSLAQDNVFVISRLREDKSGLSSPISLSPEFVGLFTTGEEYKPEFSTEFPASLITTEMEWGDLVLPGHVLEELREIELWAKHGDFLMSEWGMSRRLKHGYRTLFHGPSGTGKTLAAILIGKATNHFVYRIDLSMVVSKYIGETEKNLANLFKQAEAKNWILFFDEADSLFGKRTSTTSSNDRYANQEVSYLLQRIENYKGLVILASNFKNNLDEAFMRRFQSVIHFPMPDMELRKRLWASAFPKALSLELGISLDDIAGKYELTGGAIINVIRYCALMAKSRDETKVKLTDVEHSIRREMVKLGRTI